MSHKYCSVCQDLVDAMVYSVAPSATLCEYYHKTETNLHQADDGNSYRGGTCRIQHEAKHASHSPATGHTSSDRLYVASNHQNRSRVNDNAPDGKKQADLRPRLYYVAEHPQGAHTFSEAPKAKTPVQQHSTYLLPRDNRLA